MKLIMIMSIGEHTEEVRKLLWSHRIPVFSELEMKGVKLDHGTGEPGNWFGHTRPPAFSHLLLVAVNDETAGKLMGILSDYSGKAHSITPIHAMQLSIEQSA